MAIITAGEREDLLAIVMEEEIALAESGAGQELGGIDAAAVVLDDGDQLLVFGARYAQPLEPGKGRPIADSEARADRPWKTISASRPGYFSIDQRSYGFLVQLTAYSTSQGACRVR